MKIFDFKIDLEQKFPHLKNAPIVEAALEIRTLPEIEWDEETTREMIKQKFKEYPDVKAQRESLIQLQIPQVSQQKYSDRWRGFICKSSDNRNIVQFNIENFVYNRLNPYENWEKFISEALRLWGIYIEYAKVKSIRRLGLRFINKISVPDTENIKFGDYLVSPPESPKDLNLPFIEFLHRDSLAVPNYSYQINIIKALKANPQIHGADIIIDIDIFDSSLENNSEFNMELIKTRFSEMRWLKNQVFFNSIAKKYLEEIK